MILEGEQSQAHVGKDEILCQEVEDLKELHGENNIHEESHSEKREYKVRALECSVSVREFHRRFSTLRCLKTFSVWFSELSTSSVSSESRKALRA